MSTWQAIGGGGDHVERVHAQRPWPPGSSGCRPPDRPRAASGTTARRPRCRAAARPAAQPCVADRHGGLIRGQREQPEPRRAQLRQPVVPVGHPGVADGEHRAHGHLHRPPVQRVGAPGRQDHGVRRRTRRRTGRSPRRCRGRRGPPARPGAPPRPATSATAAAARRAIEASAPRCTAVAGEPLGNSSRAPRTPGPPPTASPASRASLRSVTSIERTG